jgi:hypothetical protein
VIQVHSLDRAANEDLFVLEYTDPNHPDHATNTIFQGSEQQVRDLMVAGGLTNAAITEWFQDAV